MKSHYSLVIIGAGPAGMSAAITVAKHQIDTLVLDQQSVPGGQIYRGVETPAVKDTSVLGSDYHGGSSLLNRFRASSAEFISNASVWNIDSDPAGKHEIGVLLDGNNRFIHCDALIVATGAQERPMPIPGWELPGVMTAGAGQILLKSAATVPDDGVVLAGCGPLLLLLACQYLRAGVKIGALLDTSAHRAWRRTLGKLPTALRAGDYLIKGAGLLREIRKARVPVYKQVSNLRARGEVSLQGVEFSSQRQTITLPTTALLLHQGIIPGVHFPQLAGCELVWNSGQHCWQADVDEWGGCQKAGIFLCGDGAGIVGAIGSALQGEITALQVACTLGAIDRHTRNVHAVPIQKSLRRQLAIRPFLDALYPPSEQFSSPADSTIVCRCEEVTAGEIRAAARLGCVGPNQAKAFTRCGMGPCQGRQCGSTVAELLAGMHQQSAEAIGYYRARPPAVPITLGQLAATAK